MLTEEIIREALRDCYDPEIPLNVMELGMLESVTLAEDHDAPGAGIVGVPTRYRVQVTIILTTRKDTTEAQLKAQIENRLAAFFEVSSISIVVSDQPTWTPARITAGGRRTLGLNEPQFPILNNKVRSL